LNRDAVAVVALGKWVIPVGQHAEQHLGSADSEAICGCDRQSQ
jgi:hypothetical protein